MAPIYVPIIKGHDGELKAITQLRKAWSSAKPLIEFAVPKHGANVKSEIVTFVERFRRFIANKQVFVDFYGIAPGTADINGEHPVAAAFDVMRGYRLPVTPVVGLDREFAPEREREMWRDLAPVVKSLGRGFCFRVDFDELEATEEIWQQIVERSADLGISPGQADVIVDLRSIRGRETEWLKEVVIDFILGSQQFAPRSVVVAASSALATVSEVPKNDRMTVERKELALWASIVADTEFSMPLLFGDYGVISPDFDRGGSITNINAKIRYTAFENIHYFRGELFDKTPPEEQYHSLAQHVMASGVYEGRDASFGDEYIYNCARGARVPRAAAPWVAVDQNRHIEHTAWHLEQIASLLIDAQPEDISRLLAGEAEAPASNDR